MATLRGDNFTKAEKFTPATESILGRGLWDGKLRVCVDSWQAAEQGDDNLTDGDIIKMGRIPEGATFLFAILSSDDLGTNVQKLHVGYGANANEWLANEDATSAIADKFIVSASGTTMTEDANVNVRYTSGGANAAANANIELITVYTSE